MNFNLTPSRALGRYDALTVKMAFAPRLAHHIRGSFFSREKK